MTQQFYFWLGADQPVALKRSAYLDARDEWLASAECPRLATEPLGEAETRAMWQALVAKYGQKSKLSRLIDWWNAL